MSNEQCKWYAQRVDRRNGDIAYEAHEGKNGMTDGFVVFEGANAKAHCELFITAIYGQASRAAMLDDMRVAREALGSCVVHVNSKDAEWEHFQKCRKALARLAKYEGGGVMFQCPKCRSMIIYGPFYQKNDLGQESLNYKCSRCGFEQNSPTADAKPLTDTKAKQ